MHLLESGTTRFYLHNDSPLSNPVDRYDVNLDHRVSAVDALLIVNVLSEPVTTDPASLPRRGRAKYPDVTANGLVTAFDALQVINHLDRLERARSAATASIRPAPAEGESMAAFAFMPSVSKPSENERLVRSSIDKGMPPSRTQGGIRRPEPRPDLSDRGDAKSRRVESQTLRVTDACFAELGLPLEQHQLQP
jgi:hypothetical protein